MPPPKARQTRALPHTTATPSPRFELSKDGRAIDPARNRSRLRPPARPEPVLSVFKGLRQLFRAAPSEGRRPAAQAARDARPPAPAATPSLRFELTKDGKAIDPARNRSRLRPAARPEPVLSLFKGLRQLFRAALSEGRRPAAQAARDARPPAPAATPSLRFELTKDGKAIDPARNPVAASAARKTQAGFEPFQGVAAAFPGGSLGGAASRRPRRARRAPSHTRRVAPLPAGILCFQSLERTNLSQNSSYIRCSDVILLLDAHSSVRGRGGRRGSDQRHLPSYHNFRFSGSICSHAGRGRRSARDGGHCGGGSGRGGSSSQIGSRLVRR